MRLLRTLPGFPLSLLLLFLPAVPACQLAPPPPGSWTDEGIDIPALRKESRAVRGDQPFGLRWMDGEHYLVFAAPPGAAAGTSPQLLMVEAATGVEKPLYDAAAMEEALAALPGVEGTQAAGLARRPSYLFLPGYEGVVLTLEGRVILYRFADRRALELLAGGEEGAAEELSVSPDGKWLAFVRGNNLWAVSTAGGDARPLTTAGGEDHLAGKLDWVYQEEIYGRGDWKGYWWSPDSQRIAFLELDESPVGEFRVEDHIPTLGKGEVWRYPLAGQPNPGVELGVVPVAGGEAVRADLAAWPPDDRLVMKVDWTPGGKAVAIQVANRIQDRIDLLLVDPGDGSVKRVLREESPTWVNRSPVTWLADGTFLWQSEADGWRHLYHYRTDGTFLGRLTSGDFDVLSVAGVDEEHGEVLATTNEGDILGRRFWRIPLDGSPRKVVTSGPGSHSVNPAPGFRFAIHSWSRADDPGAVELIRLPSGRPLRVLGRGDRGRLVRDGFRKPEFLTVPNRDGFPMEAMVVKPPGFREGRRYPVLVYIYGGPNAPQVRDRWGGFRALWHDALARRGYLIWVCDNRSASGKGHANTEVMYRRAGETELRDVEDGLDWLVRRGWADPSRIGIWGWSYGGFMTTYALTHSDRFRMGIAGGPVTDWHNYDTVYTERYMDTPEHNKEGYEASSVVRAAANLHGALLLIHGTMDENVHMANTLQLAEALEKAEKPFDLMLYPRNRHGIVRPAQSEHLYRTMTRFLLEHL